MPELQLVPVGGDRSRTRVDLRLRLPGPPTDDEVGRGRVPGVPNAMRVPGQDERHAAGGQYPALPVDGQLDGAFLDDDQFFPVVV